MTHLFNLAERSAMWACNHGFIRFAIVQGVLLITLVALCLTFAAVLMEGIK